MPPRLPLRLAAVDDDADDDAAAENHAVAWRKTARTLSWWCDELSRWQNGGRLWTLPAAVLRRGDQGSDSVVCEAGVQ